MRPEIGHTQKEADLRRKIVANLWTKFTAFDCYAMGANVKKCKNLNETLVAATYLKAKTYVFARFKIRDREVGGSNPLAPTNHSSPHGDRRRSPFFVCGTIVAEPLGWHFYGAHHWPFRSIGRMRVAPRSLRIGMALQILEGCFAKARLG